MYIYSLIFIEYYGNPKNNEELVMISYPKVGLVF